MRTIELHGEPSVEDLLLLQQTAREECYCTNEMRVNLPNDPNPETCKPCACRFALNAITSVAHVMRTDL